MLMKKIVAIVITFIALFSGMAFAQTNTSNSWGDKGSSPIEILDRVAGEANSEYRIQETSLDQVNDDQ